jgi:ethanolamine utilization protein EutN
VQLARVIGTLVATQKHRAFEGSTLLLVQAMTPDDVPQGPLLLAVDTVGAGVHERVLIVLDGKAAADAMQRKGTPVDAAIVGIVDRVDLPEEARGA